MLASNPSRDARVVMIAKHPVWPSSGRQGRFVILHQAGDRLTVPRCAEQGEVERQMDAIEIAPVIFHDLLDWEINIANEKAIIELINDPAHLCDNLLHFRTVGRIERKQGVVRWHPGLEIQICGIVAQSTVFDEVPQHIHAEAVDAAAEPKAHHVINRLPHLWIAPVQVRLLLEESMVIILSGRRIERPGAAAEFRHPVVWLPPGGTGILPEIPVPPRVIA